MWYQMHRAQSLKFSEVMGSSYQKSVYDFTSNLMVLILIVYIYAIQPCTTLYNLVQPCTRSHKYLINKLINIVFFIWFCLSYLYVCIEVTTGVHIVSSVLYTKIGLTVWFFLSKY